MPSKPHRRSVETFTCPKCEARRGAVVRSSLVALGTDPVYNSDGELEVRTVTWCCLSCLLEGRMTVAGRGTINFTAEKTYSMSSR